MVRAMAMRTPDAQETNFVAYLMGPRVSTTL